ncbi:NmrA family NAD(P)-binding protein [Nonomuraea mangrovi]|uniref:NmrA family NAD(P)-binding protein n=1 Tax=Nonomuraea mangrovi TaxID=2316207 RepID=A0ABW4T486_9ACTN
MAVVEPVEHHVREMPPGGALQTPRATMRALGAEVVLGDLTRPETVAAALEGVGRMYFAMPVSPDHLLAATVVATVARERGGLAGLVGMSQMTVSQMSATSTAESHQQRLHWLAEQVFNWSGLPVVHIRPTSFLNNPLFTTLAAQSIRENGTIALPFGTGRTSPVAVDDVARVVATVLRDPAPHAGNVYELTGPRTVDMTEMAEEFSKALGRAVSYLDVPLDRWLAEVLAKAGLPPHTEQHIATMARLHRENRYDRASDDVERVTGVPAQTIESFVAARRDFYLG